MKTTWIMIIIHDVVNEESITKPLEKRPGALKEVVIYDDKGNQALPFPRVLDDYNQGMGGYDIHSQLISIYITARTHYRVWWPLFLFLLDSAVVNSFLIYRSSNNLDHRTFQREIALRLLQLPLSYGRKQLLRLLTTGQKPIQISRNHHEYVKMDRGYCRGKKGCKGSTQPSSRGKRYVLGDVDVNTIGHRPGRTVWGCKQCSVNCCKIRECWLALPDHGDTAITGAYTAFPLVEKEDNEKRSNQSNSRVSNSTKLDK